MKAEKIILLTELQEMFEIEINRLKAINENHVLLDGMRYASGYMQSCTEDHSNIERLAEIGRATEKALFLHGANICGLVRPVRCVVELLQWAKRE